MLKRYILLSSSLLVTVGFAQDEVVTRASDKAPASVPTVVTQPSTGSQVIVIHTDIVTSPLSDVPGIAGAKFSSFDRPALSPNGMQWAITADTDLPTNEDDVLLVNGSVVLREDDSPSFVDPGEVINFFDQGIGINDAGQFVFSNDTDGATTSDEYIVRGEPGGTYTVIAREGDQITGAPAGWLNGQLNTTALTASGDVGYESDNVTGTPNGTADDTVVMLGSTLLGQKGVTVPAGQLSGLAQTWEFFDFEDLFVSSDGAHYILQGDLDGDTVEEDDIVVVDGTVVIQENYPLPGGPADVVDSLGIFGVYMSHSGDWMADGDFDVTDADWVVYNGALVAMEGNPIHVGTTEAYDSGSFFVNVCNGVGDYLVGGTTDAADSTRNAVIVLNNERVIVREGDPIDLDGNGLFDDDLYYNFFGSDDFRLTDDLKLYFVSTVRDGSSTSSIGDVFVMMDLMDGVGSAYCVAQPNSTGGASSISGTGNSAAASNMLTLDVCGLPAGVMGYFVTSLETNLIVNAGGSSGDLCIASFTMGRYSMSTLTSDAGGNVSLSLDLTQVPSPVGPVAAVAGETRYWQFWHRDTNAMGATSNFSNALCVTFE